MDRSPSAHSPDVRDSRPSFRKPANETSRRNYRRHSPSSSQSRSPSPGGWKRERSPSCQDNVGLKKGRNIDMDNGKGREDTRSRRTWDAPRHCGSNSRDRHGRVEDHDNSYSRRHSSHHDRSYQTSLHARSDYSRYDDGRYARRSPDRSTRERNAEDIGCRRRENRDKDVRVIDARSADRDRVREEEADARDRYKSRDREARRGQARYAEKYRDDDPDVEAEEARHRKGIDSGTGRKDANGVEGRDRDVDNVDSREGLKLKVDIEKSKEREGRHREREDGLALESNKGDRRNRDKGYKRCNEHRRRGFDAKEYSSEEREGTEELSRERSHGQDHSRKGDKDKRYSAEKGRSKFSSVGVQEAGTTSDHMDETERLDDKTSKGSKWGPEADNPDSNAGSSDPEVAKMAAMKAAALVNINLGGIKSVDEKKKMLWGSKDQKPAAATGTNRWDTVRFADRERQEKFNKLMGVKGESGAAGGQGNSGNLFTSEKQEELQHDLEKQFTAGLRRRDGRTVGLGL